MISQHKQRFAALLSLVCLLALAASLLAQHPPLPPTPTTILPPVITALHPSSIKAGSGPIAVFVRDGGSGGPWQSPGKPSTTSSMASRGSAPRWRFGSPKAFG